MNALPSLQMSCDQSELFTILLPNASEFLAINANLRKIAFGRAFAREILYM